MTRCICHCRIMRMWVTVAVTILCLLVTVPANANEIALELWDGVTGPDREGIDAIIKDFNVEYAGKFRINRTPLPWNDFYTKLRVAVAGNAAPDLAILHRDRLPEQVLAGVLRPIDKYFDSFNFKDTDWLPGLTEGGKYLTTRYGVPLDVHPLALYYDVDAVAIAGLPGAPRNAVEYIDYAKKLTKPSNGELSTTRWGTRFGIWGPQYYTLLRQLGGDYFGGPNADQVIIDNAAGQSALQYVHNLMYELHVAPPPEFWPDPFKGQVALWVEGIWNLKQIQTTRDAGGINFQVARADNVYGPNTVVWGGSHMFVYPNKVSPDSARDTAVMTFIDYFGKRSVVWASFGQLPARRAAVASDAFRNMKDHLIFAQQQFGFFPHQPWGTGGGRIENLMWPALQNKLSVKAALEDGKRKMEVYITERKRQLNMK